jgi:hypothetical protein
MTNYLDAMATWCLRHSEPCLEDITGNIIT